MKFVVFRDINQRWYWELRGTDSAPVASSPMGFSSEQKAFTAIQNLRTAAPKALVFDLLGALHEDV